MNVSKRVPLQGVELEDYRAKEREKAAAEAAKSVRENVCVFAFVWPSLLSTDVQTQALVVILYRPLLCSPQSCGDGIMPSKLVNIVTYS